MGFLECNSPEICSAVAVTKSGVGTAAFHCDVCRAKPCNCLWSGLNDHTQAFGLEMDSSVSSTSFPFYFLEAGM